MVLQKIVNSVGYFYFFSTYFKVFTVTPTLTHERTVFSVARLECLKGFPIVTKHQVSLFFKTFLGKEHKNGNIIVYRATREQKNNRRFILFIWST